MDKKTNYCISVEWDAMSFAKQTQVLLGRTAQYAGVWPDSY